MAAADLAQFLALSDQLVALLKAGVPVHLGLSARDKGAAQACERVSAVVARRLGEGASIPEALENRIVPAAYRAVVQLALSGGDLSTVLAGASCVADAQEQARYAVRKSLRYPLLICGLAYVGIVLFCLFLVPLLEGMYQSMGIRAGWGLLTASFLLATLPYWVALPPLVLLLLVAGLHWTSTHSAAAGGVLRWLAWFPGISQITAEQRCARFAETLAGYLETGTPLPIALVSASAAWESDGYQQGTQELAASLASGRVPRDDSPFALRLPPLLRWAIWHADDGVGRPRALRMAAGLYRESTERRVQRLRVVAPIVTCLVIGGSVTLLYALLLFVPVAQMIQGLAG